MQVLGAFPVPVVSGVGDPLQDGRERQAPSPSLCCLPSLSLRCLQCRRESVDAGSEGCRGVMGTRTLSSWNSAWH